MSQIKIKDIFLIATIIFLASPWSFNFQVELMTKLFSPPFREEQIKVMAIYNDIILFLLLGLFIRRLQ